jgi:hypothetical protein
VFNAAADRKKGRVANDNECWQYQFYGTCSYGDSCRKDHVGEAGALKHEITDSAGYCLQQQEGECRRKNCPLLHRDTDASEQPAKPKPPSKVFMLHSGWDEDFTKRTRPKVFPVLAAAQEDASI